MPQLSDASVQILDGAVVLFQRKRSSAWQMRYKVGSRWQRATTKERALVRAKEVAQEIYLRARFREQEGLPLVTKRFSAVARLAQHRMQTAAAQGAGLKIYTSYIAAIDNYLTPFFGHHNIDRIDHALIKQFDTWRAGKMGHAPKASTVNSHNSALNRVFDEALERGFITKVQIPTLVKKKKDGERRPDFTLDEYRRLYRYMRSWIRRGRDGKSRQMRALLRDYVLILANTGMRHGTESYGLKWKHISFFEERGRRFLLMTVSGKTGQREIVARHHCVVYLKRIHERSLDICGMSFEDVLAKGVDEYVFRLPDGTQSLNLHQTFERLLKDAGLLLDRRSDVNRTLYSLRHTYATLSLVHSHVHVHLLAKQMGTSTLMIERHYSHLTPRMRAAELAGFNWFDKAVAAKLGTELAPQAQQSTEADNTG